MDRRLVHWGGLVGLILAVAGILALLVGVGGGAGATVRQARASPSPASLPTTVPRQTPSPTPRVLVIATSSSTPTPPSTSTPTPPSAPTATAVPAPTATPVPPPTATPTTVAAPTATPATNQPPSPPPPDAQAETIPDPPVADPPVADPPVADAVVQDPTAALAARLEFGAEDWVGGYYQAGAFSYGRPWTAVYGALSPYPRAALVFDLAAPPETPAALTLTGLDDEWADANGIVVEVNGVAVYSGPSPFADWDGVGNGAGAAWIAVSFEIPAGVLRAGSNEVAVANRTPSANVGLPPYVLLAEAALELSPGVGTAQGPPAHDPLPEAASASAPPSAFRLAFTAADWADGYYRGDGLAYGRPWVAVYGASSPYPRAALRFSLAVPPAEPAALTLLGLDDEWTGPNGIAVEVNGVAIYAGPGPFADWDGVGFGEDATWTQATFEVPAGLLRAGENEIAVSNLAPAAGVGVPPYVLLAEATLEAAG